ncbi:MAG TPA: crosslink repair DNA glycosylase YcaQ family protein [Gemmatimonadaceae bacterium]|nr:crosslink repair DNA glycosylase YcaQ family protein [Gemmatimonadaceae bacterium]
MPNHAERQRARRSTLSADEARRLALGALGFGGKRPARAGAAHGRATAARLGAIQVDSVNVLARAHYLPTFSRYGPYPVEALDHLVHGSRELFEYWGHAACFLPMDLYPLMRWRMQGQVHAWSGISARARAFHEAVFNEIAARGPLAAGELSSPGRSTGPWWGWSDGKRAVEFLFRQGRLAIAGRRHFERLYDVTERVVPAHLLGASPIPARDAQKELIVRAARAMGVGAARDILQYYHIEGFWDRQTPRGLRKPPPMQAVFDELVEAGRLVPVHVEGWKTPAYMVPEARIPRTIDARAIVSPFDPLMWERKWTKAVTGFDYQIEIYVPAHKRVHGYYVLPFLMGDRFVARLDLKADRKTRRLLVHAAYVEEGCEAGAVADAVAAELRLLVAWLGLDRIVVGRRGTLVPHLRLATAG